MKDLRGLKIHCDNEEEKKELLEEATKQGFSWVNSREKLLENRLLWDITSTYRFDSNMDLYNMDGQKGYISYKEYKAMSGFTKADLKPCMVVEMEYENNTFLAMICTNADEKLCVSSSQFWCPLAQFNDDMVCKTAIIKKVYGFSNRNGCAYELSAYCRELLFERKEEPKVEEMTLSQVCELLGKNIKIVKE